jgi:hypothetical protein
MSTLKARSLTDGAPVELSADALGRLLTNVSLLATGQGETIAVASGLNASSVAPLGSGGFLVTPTVDAWVEIGPEGATSAQANTSFRHPANVQLVYAAARGHVVSIRRVGSTDGTAHVRPVI